MSSNPQEQQQIVRGQLHLIWAAKGTVLLVKSGSMLVSRAIDAERLYIDAISLREGECYTAERSGRLYLRGGSGGNGGNANVCSTTTIILINPMPTGNWLRRLIGRLRVKSASASSLITR